MNDNQNINVRDGRTSSRVLAPPGGRSSLTLGLEPAPPKKKEVLTPPAQAKETAPASAAVAAAADVGINGNEKKDENKPVNNTEGETTDTATSSTSNGDAKKQTKTVSSNAFAAGSSMNGAQVMTGRPTSRVLAPPGGKSNWTLG